MQLWQAVALKKTIKAISIRCWDDELNVSRFPLSQRNEQWEVGLLKRARKVLRTAGYKGRMCILLYIFYVVCLHAYQCSKPVAKRTEG